MSLCGEIDLNTLLLVSGGNGFIGRAVLSQAKQSADVDAVALPREGAPAAVAKVREANPGRRIALVNLAWPSLRRYSAEGAGGDDATDEWPAFRDYARALARAAAENDVRFFQVGSGLERYALADPPEIGEPYQTYARRKEEIWRLVSAASEINAWRLRVHFVFGPGEAPGRIVPAAIAACQSGEAFPIGALERRRCWLYVDDLASGLIAAAISDRPENWDICGRTAISFAELCALIEQAVSAPLNTTEITGKIADASCLLIEPEHPAPFLSPDAGAPESLGKRLTEYADFLTTSAV